MNPHGLLEQAGRCYLYHLTDQGIKVALLFTVFHKRICGPLANSLLAHPTDETCQPPSKIETAYHKADRAIPEVIDLVAA